MRLLAYFLACSLPSRGFFFSFLASRTTRGNPFSSRSRKSTKPFFNDSKYSPKVSISFSLILTFGSSWILAGPFSSSKKRHHASSSNLLILILAFTSFSAIQFLILLGLALWLIERYNYLLRGRRKWGLVVPQWSIAKWHN